VIEIDLNAENYSKTNQNSYNKNGYGIVFQDKLKFKEALLLFEK